MIYLYYLMFVCISQGKFDQDKLNYFTKEDTNNDGILTTNQFINALTNLFRNEVIDIQGLEKSKDTCNSFGREFAGKKKTKGSIKVSDVNTWIITGELETAYISWRSNSQNTSTNPPPSSDPNPPPPPPFPKSSSNPKPLKSKFPDF